MRRTIVVAIGVLLSGSIVGNAQQSGQIAPTFRAGTALVDFNIVAVDTKGNPVTDLRRDEIALFDDDQVREIAFFQFEGAASSLASPGNTPVALPAGTFTNRIEYTARPPKNLIAIVVDLINTSIGQQLELQNQLLQNLKQVPADAHVGLYVISEHAVALHDFTQDAESLKARLEKNTPTVQTTLASSARVVQQLLSTGAPHHAESLRALAEADARIQGDLNQQFMKTRRRLTLQALESVGHHLAGTPGRKSIVWVSYGFPLTDFYGTYTDQVSGASQELATQNVAVYTVDAQGLPPYRNAPREQGRIEGTSELIASITGGRATRNNNDLAKAVDAAAEDIRGTYSLGFYAANSADNRWHRLSVKVTRPGVSVRHRQGYLASASVNEGSDWPHERWNELAYRPLTSTAVRVDVRPTKDATRLNLSVEVVVDDLQFRPADGGTAADVEIALVEKTTKGPTNVRVQSAGIQIPAGAAAPAVVPFSATFSLNAQTTSVRVIVRDRASGKFGSLDLPLDKLPKP